MVKTIQMKNKIEYWKVGDIIIYDYPAGGSELIIITPENQKGYIKNNSLFRKATKKQLRDWYKKLHGQNMMNLLIMHKIERML